jgi:hypothetical protein
MKKPKFKDCPICKKPFQLFRTTQQVCSMECAVKFNSEKEVNKRVKAMKKENRTYSWYIGTLQEVFNTYIRLRDVNKPCISCLRNDADKWDAGHFWAAGNYSFLRFNEDNVHKQCSRPCNKDLHGNLLNYRINLINKIGLDRVQWLDDNRHKELNLTIPEIQSLIKLYKQKILELKKN